MALPLISVSLCTHNRCELLKKTLLSLEKQQTGNLFVFEVIVIDDGSTDNTRDFLAEFAKHTSLTFRYIYENGIGVGGARNSGIVEARGEWVAFIDDDEIAEPDWLQKLAETAFTYDADCVGAPVLMHIPDGNPAAPVGAARKLLGENPGMKRPHGKNSLLDKRLIYNMPSTGNSLVKRELFDRIGMFNSSLSYGEDMDFFRRARKNGYRIVRSPDAIVRHLIPPERLESSFLLPLAARSGASQAYFDRMEWGHIGTIRSSFLRIIHAIIVTMPMLCVALIRKDKSWLISRQCSLNFMKAYISKTVSMLFSRNNEGVS